MKDLKGLLVLKRQALNNHQTLSRVIKFLEWSLKLWKQFDHSKCNHHLATLPRILINILTQGIYFTEMGMSKRLTLMYSNRFLDHHLQIIQCLLKKIVCLMILTLSKIRKHFIKRSLNDLIIISLKKTNEFSTGFQLIQLEHQWYNLSRLKSLIYLGLQSFSCQSSLKILLENQH